MSLILRILTRVINEGSTIAMKAINANPIQMLKKALHWLPLPLFVEKYEIT